MQSIQQHRPNPVPVYGHKLAPVTNTPLGLIKTYPLKTFIQDYLGRYVPIILWYNTEEKRLDSAAKSLTKGLKVHLLPVSMQWVGVNEYGEYV